MADKAYNRFTCLISTVRRQKNMPISQEMTDFIGAKNSAGIVNNFNNVPESFRLKPEIPNAKDLSCATCHHIRTVFSSTDGSGLWECLKHSFKMRCISLTTCGTRNVYDR